MVFDEPQQIPRGEGFLQVVHSAHLHGLQVPVHVDAPRHRQNCPLTAQLQGTIQMTSVTDRILPNPPLLAILTYTTVINGGESRGSSKSLRGVVRIAQMVRKATVAGTGAEAQDGEYWFSLFHQTTSAASGTVLRSPPMTTMPESVMGHPRARSASRS